MGDYPQDMGFRSMLAAAINAALYGLPSLRNDWQGATYEILESM